MGLYRDNGKENGNYSSILGIMEKKMKTTLACWGYIGIMEKTMETTVVYWGYIGIASCPGQLCKSFDWYAGVAAQGGTGVGRLGVGLTFAQIEKCTRTVQEVHMHKSRSVQIS